jgi:hypothetical protein
VIIIIVLGMRSNLVGHLNSLHGLEVVVLEITAFVVSREVIENIRFMSIFAIIFLLLLELFLVHHSPSPLLLEWDLVEDVLLIPLSAIKLTFVVVIASNMDVEVGDAMVSLRLTFSNSVGMISAPLVARFALQHGSNMEGLEYLFAIPMFFILTLRYEMIRFKLLFSIFDEEVTFVGTLAVHTMFLSQVGLEDFNQQTAAFFCFSFIIRIWNSVKALVLILEIVSTLQENADAQHEDDETILRSVFISEDFCPPSEFGISFLLSELDWKDEILVSFQSIFFGLEV